MYRLIVALVAVMGIALFLTGTAAQQPGAKPAAEAAKPVVIEEDVLVVFVDEPAHHFHRVHEFFLKKHMKSAAEQVRVAAGFMKLEAARATDEGKEGLNASVKELERLADDLEKGVDVSGNALSHAFARAHHALANHHYLKAAEEHAKNAPEKAGHDLKAAAVHVEQAAAWLGHDLDKGALDVLKGARLVGGKLIKGAGWAPDEVGKAIEDIGKLTEEVGKKIEPTTKT